MIIGAGRYGRRARRVAQRQGIRNIHFLGPVPQSEVSSYFAAIDVGLCPYDVTAGRVFSMKLIEYVAAGKPVVTTRLSGLEDWNLEGVAVVDQDPRSFADAVVSSMNASPPSRESVLPFDAGRVGALLYSNLESLINADIV